jgi:hypothetical protein
MSNNPTDKEGKLGKTKPVAKGPKLVEMPKRPVRKIEAVWIVSESAKPS